MEPSVLHSQIPVFEAQDDSLYFVLGLAHAATLFRRWAGLSNVLDSEAPHSGDATARFPAQEQAADDCLYFFLGLLSFAEHYDQALEGIQAGNPHALAGTALPTLSVAAQFTAQAEPQPHLFIRDLLR